MNKLQIKKINKDWKDAFPELKTIGSNQLFEIVGPILVGIELVKSKFQNQYRPYIVISSLFGSDVATNRGGNQLKNCLNSPDFYFGLVNQKQIQFDIGYDSTPDKINEAIKEMKKQHLPLEQNITVNELFDFIDSHKSHTSIISDSSGALAYLMEFKYLLSVYLNNEELKNNVLAEIESDKKFWNMEHFEMWIGDYNDWIEKLKKTKQSELLNSINKILSDSKLKKINRFDLKNE
ncbi:hypothetical protein [Bizionia arctica]|uniref:Uncharacterized protein n=1 Tax=Bizionia arctica TaxID=1495645 RepID=A0A917LN19_9FLAO|nr:hypothetical protein [Bizionia arctica]GGG46670.1 hypothetical protein GCM10010976_17660 [Bizionia arctica]